MAYRIAYYRCSTGDQSIEAQRADLAGPFDKEYADEGVSGAILAADRPDFAKLLAEVRPGDTLCVYSLDRLGRDALDVQSTVQRLLDNKVAVDVRGLGPIVGDAGKLIVAVLAQVAQMERNRIKERCDSGRVAARAALAATGSTHRGKHGLGRKPVYLNKAVGGRPEAIAAWRTANGASIAATAKHFDISVASVKRYCAGAASA